MSRFSFPYNLLVSSLFMLSTTSCAPGKAYVDGRVELSNSASDGVPVHQSAKLTEDIRGTSKRSRDELEKEARELAEKFKDEQLKQAAPNAPCWTQELEFYSDGKGYRFHVRRESGWLPKECFEMLDKAKERGDIINYHLHADGAVHDGNHNVAADNGENQLKRGVVVVRKNNGAYAIAAFDNRDDAELGNYGAINLAKLDTPEAIAKAVNDARDIVPTNWKLPQGSCKNVLARIRTSRGVMEIYVPGVAADGTVLLDKELESHLRKWDALPKSYKTLGAKSYKTLGE